MEKGHKMAGRWLGLAFLLAVVLASCGGGAPSEGTSRLGGDMALALRTLARCDDMGEARCDAAIDTMVTACVRVVGLAEAGIEDREYGKVDVGMRQFCDEWAVILETPVFLADAKMIELAQAIDAYLGE